MLSHPPSFACLLSPFKGTSMPCASTPHSSSLEREGYCKQNGPILSAHKTYNLFGAARMHAWWRLHHWIRLIYSFNDEISDFISEFGFNFLVKNEV